MSNSQAHWAPYSLPHIKAAIGSCRLLKCALHFCLYMSIAISYIAHYFWGEAWSGGKTPSNRSTERPISCSTICPSNDYLVALWCDTVGWRLSVANILSLSLCISTRLCTSDDTWSFVFCPNTKKYTPTVPLHQRGKKEVMILYQYVYGKKWTESSFVLNLSLNWNTSPHYSPRSLIWKYLQSNDLLHFNNPMSDSQYKEINWVEMRFQ